ncbi:uncharacterized protein LOC111641443 [Centruroides sculpturatus]|uniref:uncharacterized protein LOC111641443 n=1 Tax=Centruroides sculpturatus TaxID=218467 RepID=UPI000C6E73DD|nr:uncharacterized protein LOC111641443 [Centruroides sculpturatus]
MTTINDELNSLTSEDIKHFTVAQLKADLRLRNLSLVGSKDCLISRIVDDNIKRKQQGNLDELATLRMRSSDKDDDAKMIPDSAELLKQIQLLQKQVETLNNRNNTPQIPAPTSQLDPNIAAVLTTLMESQKQLIERQINSPSTIQITSTNDTANSIPIFRGDMIDNALEWLKEVERISTLANWTDELKLTNTISRLAGSARNWQLTQGNRYNNWIEWKVALTSRFKRRITMQEFLAYQADRKLKRNESLVDYIYAKDALLEKAPFTIPQPDRISMIIGDITEEKWQIALATQNSNTVEELIDRAMALDAIRNMQHEYKSRQPYGSRPSPKITPISSNPYNEQLRKYNPETDDLRDITCWRCGTRGHASFMCSLPPPQKGSPIARPKNSPSRFEEIQNRQTNDSSQHIENTTNPNNSSPHGITGPKFTDLRRNTKRNSATRPEPKRANDSNSINCIKTDIKKRALIPATINNQTEVQALCDPCADITVIQQSCVPPDCVIHPWTDGEFQVVDHEIKPIGWISLNIKIGNIDHLMPKIGICKQLPFSLILGFDWQQQVQARCTYDPNGSLCISTPSALHLYECIHASKNSISCISSNDISLPPLDDVTLPTVVPNCFSPQTQLIPKSTGLSKKQQIQLDAVIGTFADVFYSKDDNIGLCPYVEFTVDLQHDKPLRCRPYCLTEPDRQFMKAQIQKWIKQGICRPSQSPYAAPAFIVEQPFHESTPRRIVVDFSRTINSITKIDPHPIDRMEDVIKRTVGKLYNSKMDVKSAFNTIRIKESDIYKTGFVTPDGHFEFLRMPFGVTNGPSTMTRAIKLAYDHLAQFNVNTYIDDISTSHNDFSYHLKVLYKILEATRSAGFKLTPEKSQFAASEISLFGRILSQRGERPDPGRTAAVERYVTLKSIHEVRSFLGFANQFRKHIRNYAVIASFIDDTPREDQLDLLTLARAEAANNVYETHLDNKRRFDLHRQPHLFKSGDLVLYDWPKQHDHKLSPMFKGPFEIVRPVGAVCYEITSLTSQRKFQKVVHVQHLRPYYKRDAPVLEEDVSSEEEEPEVEVQDQVDDRSTVIDQNDQESSRHGRRRNRYPPKRLEQ